MIKSSTIIFTLVLIILTAGMPMAARVATPVEPPEGVKVISIDEANQFLNQRNVYVYDLRKELYYIKGHIPGAVSLPYRWTEKNSDFKGTGGFDISRLPADKNMVIIFHGDGPEEWRSYYISKAAKEAGYKNVKWLRDGYSNWANRGYTVEH